MTKIYLTEDGDINIPMDKVIMSEISGNPPYIVRDQISNILFVQPLDALVSGKDNDWTVITLYIPGLAVAKYYYFED